MRISTLATNTALSYSAIASMSTLSSFVNRSFHVVHAFSPNSSINNNNNNNNNNKIMVTSKKNKNMGHVLNLSSTAPIKLDDDEIRIKSNSNSDVNESYTNNKPTVVATALAKSFIPAPNGRCGVMAVKLREEDYIPLDISNQVPEAPMIEGDEALISQTGMFGGSGNKATSQMKKATEVEDLTGKAVQFSNGRTGTIIAQRPPMAFILCDFSEWDETNNIVNDNENEGNNEIISILSKRSSVTVGNHLFGQVVDCQGNNIQITPAEDSIERAIFAPIPQIKDIALINEPLLTGTVMVDALAPIGKGQNMLVIGQDSGVGQRDLLIGAIKSQLRNNSNDQNRVKCVYALTTQDTNERQEVLQKLKDEDLLDDIIVVAARDHGVNGNKNVISSAESITVAATACSIAEAIALSRGEDSFVVVDNIDDHKQFWDWTTRVLVDIYGVDAVVKDDINGGASSEMRGFYSSLIQRAGRFNVKNGGGSMTLSLITNLEGKVGDDPDENISFKPEDFEGSSEKIKQRIAILVNKGISLTPETLRKIQIPIPVASDSEQKRRLALQHVDDLISMSDGQIWFDETLHAKGQRPAIDPQRSITRVGIGADTPCRADAPALRGLAGGLRFDFAQAASLEGAGKNSGAEKQLLKRDSYLLAMHQDAGEVRSLSENCVVLLASSSGLLDDIIKQGGTAGSDLGSQKISSLLEYVWKSSPSTMQEIDETMDMSSTTRTELETIIKQYLLS